MSKTFLFASLVLVCNALFTSSYATGPLEELKENYKSILSKSSQEKINKSHYNKHPIIIIDTGLGTEVFGEKLIFQKSLIDGEIKKVCIFGHVYLDEVTYSLKKTVYIICHLRIMEEVLHP